MRWPAVLTVFLSSAVLVGVPVSAETPVLPDDVESQTPHALTVPWPHVGDAGSYSRSIVRMSDVGDDSVLTVQAPSVRESFVVEPAQDQYDHQGLPHKVVSFRTWLVTDGLDSRYLLDAQDGTTAALTVFERSSQGFTNYTYPGGLSHKPPLCGLRNALQGAADPGDGVVALQPSLCRRAYYAADGGAGFTRVREDPWGDGVAVGFQQTGADTVVLVWYTSDIPYPVRMLEETSAGTYVVLDLTHFERGTIPAAQGRSGMPQLAPLRMAEHEGVGADESGIEHPFPWREAWAAAQADDGVAEFLASHPDAVVSRSVYNFEERHRPSGTPAEQQDSWADAWYFILDDGQEAQTFAVRHVVGQRSVVLPVVGKVDTFPIDEIEVEEREGRRADPYTLLAPPSVPTVASSLAWWDAFATKRFRDEGPNGWLTILSCSCGKPWATTNVGRLAGNLTSGESTTWTWEASILVTNWQGEATLLVENVVESDYGRASLPVRLLRTSIPTELKLIIQEARDRLPDLQDLPATVPQGKMLDVDLRQGPGGGDGGPPATALTPKTAQSSPRAAPATALAVGVAAAGAAGLVGMAWLAKLLLAPLFSRVRRESALDHPVRATLFDLVEAEPGLHLQEIMRRTGRGAGAVRHHLAKLEDVGLVKSRLGGGFLCFFPAQAGAAAMAAASVTKSHGARRVLEAAREGGTAAELARRTGLAPGTVDHHLARLASAGVVRREGMRWLA